MWLKLLCKFEPSVGKLRTNRRVVLFVALTLNLCIPTIFSLEILINKSILSQKKISIKNIKRENCENSSKEFGKKNMNACNFLYIMQCAIIG